MTTNHEAVGSNPTGQDSETAHPKAALERMSRFLLGEACHRGGRPVTCFWGNFR